MRRSWAWILLGVAICVVVVGLLALNYVISAYLRGPEFVKLVAEQTGQALNGVAGLEPLKWTGSSAYSEAFDFKGSDAAVLKKVEARQVRASINWRKALDGVWRVDEITVVRLDGELGAAKPAQPQAVDAPAISSEVASFSWLPQEFELGRLKIDDGNLNLPGLGELKNSELELLPDGEGWVVSGQGGKLQVPNRPELKVENFRLRLQGGRMYLNEARLIAPGGGKIKLTGEYGKPTDPYVFTVEWEKLLASEILKSEWSDKLSGLIAGRATITGGAGKPEDITGSFRLSEGKLSGLPILAQIAKFTRSPQFERMTIQEMSGDFRRYQNVVTLKNGVMESKGLLRMEGTGQVSTDDRISGEFQVGVTPQTLQWLPGSQERVFTTARNGYLWAPVRVSGTLSSPQEDLSPRLASAMGQQVISDGVQLLQSAPGRAIDATQNPGGAVNDAADTLNKAVDLLTPLLP